MPYQHRQHSVDQNAKKGTDTSVISALPVGKVVCVGRNYAEHAKELNNPVPTEPILFLKPSTALVPMDQPWGIPADRGSCHIETEMALLIDKSLTQASESECLSAIAGVGIGYDLTLRERQSQLKEKGHPWEVAKAFDGSCPLSAFIGVEGIDWSAVKLQLVRNDQLQQDGCSGDMITPVAPLLAYISRHFTLLPGDVVLTGTPAGVGPIAVGDRLCASLNNGALLVESVVAGE